MRATTGANVAAWRLRSRVTIVAAAYAAFIGVWFALAPVIGPAVSPLLGAAVAVSAWLLGTRAGIVAGALAAPMLMLLAAMSQRLGADIVLGAQPLVTGGTLSVLIGALVGYMRDTRARAMEALHRFEHLAHIDHLTDLANRALFMRMLHQAVARADRTPNGLAVLVIDIDDFKSVNDRHGHPCGDRVLQTVADRIRTSIRQSDIAARLGGDEFAVVLEGVATRADAEAVASKLSQVIYEPIAFHGEQVRVTASVGVATYPDAGPTAELLIEHADEAMYAAKAHALDRKTVALFRE